MLLTNPISAIYTPFSIILYYEIFLLIFYLPRSFTTSILKQFEIISLIIIRRIFYDIPKLDLNTESWLGNPDNLQITYDLLCILILFFLIYLFNLVKSRIETKKSSKSVIRFIDSKKIISIVLIPVMLVLFVLGIYNWYSIGMSSNFASSFYYVNEVFYTTFFCCLFSIIPMMLEGGNLVPSSSLEWLNLILMAFLCQFGGQYFITHAIGKISASGASIGLLMQPLTATILAAIIFSEILTSLQILFALISLFGIYLARINLNQ